MLNDVANLILMEDSVDGSLDYLHQFLFMNYRACLSFSSILSLLLGDAVDSRSPIFAMKFRKDSKRIRNLTCIFLFLGLQSFVMMFLLLFFLSNILSYDPVFKATPCSLASSRSIIIINVLITYAFPVIANSVSRVVCQRKCSGIC